jgi:hypothetical protein
MKIDTTDVVKTIQNQIDELNAYDMKYLLDDSQYYMIQGQIYALTALQAHYEIANEAELNALENQTNEY